jgi:GTPase involved in cell partitioning and DNA repair
LKKTRGYGGGRDGEDGGGFGSVYAGTSASPDSLLILKYCTKVKK